MDKLTKAKAVLILDQPFFATLLMGFEIIEDNSVVTMETNGDWIKYNPEFVRNHTVSEIVFVLSHETLHTAFHHMYERGNRDNNKWNIATDYVINDILVRDQIGSMPDGALHNPNLVKQGNGLAKSVYDLLQNPPPKKSGKENKGEFPSTGEAGGSLDKIVDSNLDQAGIEQKKAETRVKVVQAMNAARMAGKLSAELQRDLDEIVATPTDWRSNLRRFFSERAKTDWSFARPKRRFLADDIYLPSLSGERMGSMVVAIDVSGSIYANARMLEAFMSELRAIKQDINPEIVHIIQFDAKVTKHDSFDKDSDLTEIKPIGGGGTRYTPVFDYIETQGLNPATVVVLTDLECSDFGKGVDYPVLWATNSKLHNHVPFGEVLRIVD